MQILRLCLPFVSIILSLLCSNSNPIIVYVLILQYFYTTIPFLTRSKVLKLIFTFTINVVRTYNIKKIWYDCQCVQLEISTTVQTTQSSSVWCPVKSILFLYNFYYRIQIFTYYLLLWL